MKSNVDNSLAENSQLQKYSVVLIKLKKHENVNKKQTCRENLKKYWLCKAMPYFI